MILANRASENKTRRSILASVLAGLVAIFFVIALFLFVIMPFLAVNWAVSPFPGFMVEQTLVVSDQGGNWGGSALGISNPQQIIQIDDQPIHSLTDFQAAMEHYPFGQVITIKTLLPDGQVYTLKGVSFGVYPLVDFLRQFLLPYLVGIAYLAMGLWVFSQRWYTSPGRAFAYVCAWSAIGNVLLFDMTTTHALTSVWSIAISQIGGALMYLALLFPEELPLIRRHRVLLLLPIAGSLALMAWGLLVVNSMERPWDYFIAWRFSYIYAGLGIAFFIGTMIYRARIPGLSANPVVSQQIKVTLWGGVFSFLPIGLWFISPLFGLTILFNPIFFLPLLLIFPATISLAILRYHMWDLDAIINRTLVYGSLTVFLVLVYAGCVVLVQWMFSRLSGIQTAAAGAISTLLIVALFDPLRRRLQVLIDRRFFRRQYDVTRTLAKFAEVARDEVSLERLNTDLVSVITETMEPSQVRLMNRLDPDHDLLIGSLEQDPLREYLTQNKEAIDVNRLELDSPTLETLREEGYALMVPMVHQGDFLGLILLGPRRSEKTYTREDRRLLTMLASQAAPALRVSQLVKQQQAEALEHDRIEQEMKVARLIQQTLLARKPPDIQGWEITVHYQPARAVGGDFYDFLPLPDGRLVVVIGDVTDKGIPAALIMATTRSVLRGAARRMLPPGIALQRSNNILVAEMLPNMFVTCFYAIIELDSGRIVYANAGHNPPCHHSQGEVSELYATGMPLGLMEGMLYEEKEGRLQPGESLLLYSDGITEAHNPRREMFDDHRLKQVIAECDHGEGLVEQLLAEVKVFTGAGAEQEDDITLLYLKRNQRLEVERC
jgi:serine phosphatase RsbU (regulator of sigma subunit)